jgi:hypothetical protein
MDNRKRRKKYAAVIKIIGLVSPKTERTIINVEEALSGRDEPIAVDWVSDPLEICKLGPMQTPSIYINGELRAVGRVPSVHELRTWIEHALEEALVA